MYNLHKKIHKLKITHNTLYFSNKWDTFSYTQKVITVAGVTLNQIKLNYFWLSGVMAVVYLRF